MIMASKDIRVSLLVRGQLVGFALRGDFVDVVMLRVSADQL